MVCPPKARVKVMQKTPKAQEMESCPATLLNSDTQVKPWAGEGKDAEKNHDEKFLFEMCTARFDISLRSITCLFFFFKQG